MSSSTKTNLIDRMLAVIEGSPTSDRLILRGLLIVFVITGLVTAVNISRSYTVTIPTSGGTITEGIVGIPRFVNPALALTRADQDVTSLIYSGLMKIGSNGDLEPDLAESVVLSEDGRTYYIALKRNLTFHDGHPLTTRDVIFTIDLLRDPDLKSPLRGNWMDVSIEASSEYEFTVTLKEPYAPFLENFTFGVMPHHLWQQIPIEQLPFSQYNTEPIGSGPFRLHRVLRSQNGLISGYTLRPFAREDNRPNLSSIELRFFQNENQLETALNNQLITSTAYLPNDRIALLGQDYQVLDLPLPRIFGIFFNQNRSAVIRDQAVREALTLAVDRERLVSETLSGFGVPTHLPIIIEPNSIESTDKPDHHNTKDLAAAEAVLRSGGWRKTESGSWVKRIDGIDEILGLTIKTGNSQFFEATANLIAEDWRRLGVEVQIEQYEQTSLVQAIIRTRDFQTLLFGLDMNRSQDLFPFWYSSQRDDPGLNIAQYTNLTVDRLLERARTIQDNQERQLVLNEIAETITSEYPAIFLFAPSLTYVLHQDIALELVRPIGRPSDRFMNVASWYARSETVWPFFDRN
jgi:peptide/nickel transport system substrate-binding protein